MARTSAPHSASSQFFINVKNNPALDFRGKESPDTWGYAVFGKVTRGMDVVNQIENTPTRTIGAFQNVPSSDVTIQAIVRINEGPATRVDSEARFQAALARYRAANPKPVLPEEARRFKVQAELAMREKRFTDAWARYQDALDVVPWWPDGYFNSALIQAELRQYREAIQSMNRYLQLEPDAPNARAAQDKIYEWEDKAR